MIAYDISDDRSRRQVFKLLENHGERVQYSVFECRLQSAQLHSLQQQLLSHIQADDSIRWYPLCAWCESSIDQQGSGEPVNDAEFYLL